MRRFLAVLPGLLAFAAPAHTAGKDCEPQGTLQFICGSHASEDAVRVPGSALLLVSGLGLGQPGQIYLIDTRSRRVRPLATSRTAADSTGDCAAPPRPDQSSFAGLSIKPGREGVFEVAAVNDGRRAIELFSFDPRRTRLTWHDCLQLPERTKPNAVALLPGGGLVVTSFYDPSDPAAWIKMRKGEPSGAVYQLAGEKFVRATGLGALPGPNGIETSADGGTIYVSAWAIRQLLVVNRASGAIRRIALDFLPDNIHRQPDGSLIVAGQRTTVEAIAACKRECPQPWTIVRVDPVSGKVTPLLQGQGDALVNYATGATMIGNTLYSAVRGDNRIVVAALPKIR